MLRLIVLNEAPGGKEINLNTSHVKVNLFNRV